MFHSAVLAAVAAAFVPTPNSARADAAPASPAAVVSWVRASAVPLVKVVPGAPWEDLEPLGRMIGDATIVAVSEGTHGAAEPLEFRNRLFQYLVERHGFTAIAIESGIVEGRAVHDYVLGAEGELPTVLHRGITWTFDELPVNRALVRWLRQYNADAKHARKINFYGFDIPGSPSNPNATRGPETAITEALQYLARVDGAAAAGFQRRLERLIRYIRFNPARLEEGPTYERLTQAERDALTAGIADLITLLEREEAKYIAASTATDYQWGYRAAIGARQADAMLRQVPVGWDRGNAEFPELLLALSEAVNVRDRAQADNVEWIVRQERHAGKILLFAHTGHVSTAPARATWSPKDRPTERFQTAGTYLLRRFGASMVTIGNLIGSGEMECAGNRCCNGTKHRLPAPPADSLEALGRHAGKPFYLLDLRTAPAPIAAWLNQDQAFGRDLEQMRIPPGRAFDIVFYVDTVTPTCGAPAAMH